MLHKFNIFIFLILIIAILIFGLGFWWIFGGFLVFFTMIVYGSFQIRANYFLNSFHQNSETKEKIVALTFDDGPSEFTSKFLDLLEKYHAKATFFCIGKQIENFSEAFQKTIEKGNEIGNHTYSHSRKTGFLSSQKMLSEIENCDQNIWKFGNIETKLFRPPFGITNPNIAKAVNLSEKKSIGWNIRSLDTVISSPEKITNRILSRIKPGSIILLHDTSEKTYKVLEKLLLFLEHENYKMLTVSQLLNFEK